MQQVIQAIFSLDLRVAQAGRQVFQEPFALGAQFGIIMEMGQQLLLKRGGVSLVVLHEFDAQGAKIAS